MMRALSVGILFFLQRSTRMGCGALPTVETTVWVSMTWPLARVTLLAVIEVTRALRMISTPRFEMFFSQ